MKCLQRSIVSVVQHDTSYPEATEESSSSGRITMTDASILTFIYSPPAPLAYIIQPETLSSSEGYLMVITTNICVNTTAR
jgi:hypothetical protein